MECKYHPSEPAGWFCQHCKIPFCANCVTDPNGSLYPNCTLCRRSLNSLSIAKQVTPIHKRVGILCKRLATLSNLFFLLAASIILVIASLAWHGIVISGVALLLVVGVLFQLMERSANDELVGFKWSDFSLSKNRSMIIKFCFYLLLVGIIAVKSSEIVGASFSQLLVALLVFLFPASTIILMMEKRFFSSLNPLKMLATVKFLRLSYVLILLITILVVFSGYYSLVVFEAESGKSSIQFLLVFCMLFLSELLFSIMGGLIFQHHVEFNYNIKSANRALLKDAPKDSMNDVDIYVQEGRFEDAEKLLIKRIDSGGSFYTSYEKLILLYAFQNKQVNLKQFANEYLEKLITTHNKSKAVDFYLSLQEKSIEFVPSKTKVALELSLGMSNKKSFRFALALIKHFNVRPGGDPLWDQLAICKAIILTDFVSEPEELQTLLSIILKRSLNQDVLEQAQLYLEIFEQSKTNNVN